MKEDPPELPESLPAGLRQIIVHCLEKEPARRFQTASDVAFALRSFATTTISTASVAALRTRTGTARTLYVAAAAATAAALVTAGVVNRNRPSSTADSPALRYEAYSGFDSAPAMSPDGKLLAFTSTRDGTQRIWLKQMIGGSLATLTSGPDTYARFHPDGTSVLFIRRDGDRNVLFRQTLVGGDPRRLVVDVDEADWSPDGRQIVMVRRHRESSSIARSSLLLAAHDGTNVRTLASPATVLMQPRWSVDGTSIAAAEFGLQTGRRIPLSARRAARSGLSHPLSKDGGCRLPCGLRTDACCTRKPNR